MSIPTEAQILNALDQSGYLFEQQVADRLEELDFHVETSWAFPDSDLGKSRELDARAIKRVLHDEVNKISIFVELLVECKAYENPMVFLQRKKNQREINRIDANEYISPLKEFRKEVSANSHQMVSAFTYLNLSDYHYYYKDPLKATQFSKIVRKGSDWAANHDGIYDSLILPLTKALEYQKQDLKVKNTGDWKYIWLFFPVVVLRDQLFSMDLSTSQRTLLPQGRISFVRHLEYGKITGFYLIDFLTFNHLGDYIENEVQQFVDHIIKLCTDDPKLFLKKQNY